MKTHPKIIDRILEGIRASETFCIVGPHPARRRLRRLATRAWRSRLQAEGKKVVCWNEDEMPQKYAFLDPDHLFQKPEAGQKFDCVIATDCASFERLGTVGAVRRRPQAVHQHRPSRKQHPLRRHELGFRRANRPPAN